MPEQFFLVERWIFEREDLNLQVTMRAEPFQIRNFSGGRFAESVSFLSFRAKSPAKP